MPTSAGDPTIAPADPTLVSVKERLHQMKYLDAMVARRGSAELFYLQPSDRPHLLGTLGAYSFHETKNYICGEGGALCINVPELVERAEIIRDKGTNRKQFFRGQVDKYTWVDVGSSYVPSELCSAFLYAQLEMMDVISTRRRAIYQRYRQLLKPLEGKGLLQLPRIPEDCQSNFHLMYVLLPDSATRDALMKYLNGVGIYAVIHYVPLHSSPMGRKYGYQPEDLPITEGIAGRLLRLPFYTDLSAGDQDEVIDAVRQFRV